MSLNSSEKGLDCYSIRHTNSFDGLKVHISLKFPQKRMSLLLHVPPRLGEHGTRSRLERGELKLPPESIVTPGQPQQRLSALVFQL